VELPSSSSSSSRRTGTIFLAAVAEAVMCKVARVLCTQGHVLLWVQVYARAKLAM
jgi:hypothetical protein